MTGPQMFDLAGKNAIVTGSTRGIGRAIAEAMIDAGAQVVISSEDEGDTNAVASALGQTGIAADVTDEAALARLVDGTIDSHGAIDILVCNAGITGEPGPFHEVGLDDFDTVLGINLKSQIALCNLALPHMAKTGGGAAILMSSISAVRGNAAISAYALSKAGVSQLARNLAVQWGPKNIRANAIAPGFIATELSKPLMKNEEFMKRRMQMTPLRRPGRVEEIAGASVFLGSDAGSFMTGQTMVIDGGTTITDGS